MAAAVAVEMLSVPKYFDLVAAAAAAVVEADSNFAVQDTVAAEHMVVGRID